MIALQQNTLYIPYTRTHAHTHTHTPNLYEGITMLKPTNNNITCKYILCISLFASMVCSIVGETYLRQQPKQPSSSTDQGDTSKFNWSIHDPHSGIKGTSEWTFWSTNDNNNSPLIVSGTYAIPIDKHYQIQLYDTTCTNIIHDNNAKARIISTTESFSTTLKQSSSSIIDHTNLQLLNVRVEMEDPSLFYFQRQLQQLTEPKTTIEFCVRLDLMTSAQPHGESVNFHEAKFSFQVENTARSAPNNDTVEEHTTAEDDSCQEETTPTKQATNTMSSLATHRSI